eukprot:Gb_16856 [translate_table: standard]
MICYTLFQGWFGRSLHGTLEQGALMYTVVIKERRWTTAGYEMRNSNQNTFDRAQNEGFARVGVDVGRLDSMQGAASRDRSMDWSMSMDSMDNSCRWSMARFRPMIDVGLYYATMNIRWDVYNKIVSFMQHGPWAVCVLCANGAISNATLRQTGMSGGTVTYEGRFEILSLSGSFLLTEVGGTQAKTGGLSVSLAGQDGNVVGGGVGGLLVAASPVQVVVGTFLVGRKNNLGWVGNIEPSIGTLLAPMSGGSPSPSPVAVLSRTETSGGTSTSKGGHGEQNPAGSSYNTQPQVLNMTSLQSMNWAGSHFEAETKSDTDTTLTGGS